MESCQEEISKTCLILTHFKMSVNRTQRDLLITSIKMTKVESTCRDSSEYSNRLRKNFSKNNKIIQLLIKKEEPLKEM